LHGMRFGAPSGASGSRVSRSGNLGLDRAGDRECQNLGRSGRLTQSKGAVSWRGAKATGNRPFREEAFAAKNRVIRLSCSGANRMRQRKPAESEDAMSSSSTGNPRAKGTPNGRNSSRRHGRRAAAEYAVTVETGTTRTQNSLCAKTQIRAVSVCGRPPKTIASDTGRGRPWRKIASGTCW
jgi:hypothetical protein